MRQVHRSSVAASIARDPLFHFVAIGAALFAVEAWRGEADQAAPQPRIVTGRASEAARAPIVADARASALIVARAERRLGREPDEADVEAETELWIEDEILYREALGRGLDRDDPVIHERLASRMRYVLEQAAIVPEPGEPELRAWFEAHRDMWAMPERVDFTHVFIADHDLARAGELAAALARGTAPELLGDRFAGGHRYRGRRLADLKHAFGEAFAEGIDAQPIGTWTRRPSRHGLHLVRVDRVEAARSADFERARLDVRRAWRDARRSAEVGAAVARMRAGWEIVRR